MSVRHVHAVVCCTWAISNCVWYRIDCGVQDPWWHIWQLVLYATQSTVWHAGVVHHYIALGLLWRVTCSWGPGQTNAGAKSIFRCEENLNAPRRWWAPSSSSVLSILAENLWGEIHKLTSECYGSRPWILRIETTIFAGPFHHTGCGWGGD